MTRDEVLQAVTKLYAGGDSEEADLALMTRLRGLLPHSKINDLIFWDFRDFTPEQVVEEAYRREAEHAAAEAGKPHKS